MNPFDYKKAINILAFFAEKEGGKINSMKALKLIFLADRYHFRNYGRTISNDVYCALPHGPVPSFVRDIIKDHALSSEQKAIRMESFSVVDKHYNSLIAIDFMVFSKTDITIMEEVYKEYGKMNQFQLREITHHFPEWKRFEEKLKNSAVKSFKMNLVDFFETTDAEYDKLPLNLETVKLSREIFEEQFS